MRTKLTKSTSPTSKKKLTKVLKAPIKDQITCLGCDKPWTNKIYSDGSYHHFYQDIKTKQYFCADCVQNEPIKEPIHHVIWRHGKYLNRQGQELCAQCKQANGKLTKEFNEKWYCSDCKQWQEEASYSGIASCYRYQQEIMCGL